MDNFSETIWLGISAKDMGNPLDKDMNPLVFSDGTDFDESGYAYEWDDQEPNYLNNGDFKCTKLKINGKMGTVPCEEVAFNVLCMIEECEEASSESARSRVNLSVFAVFILCSIFKTFSALVGPAF